MAFIRKIKKGNNVYLALVENKRLEGKVVQRVIKYIGKEIEGEVSRTVNTKDVRVKAVKQYADVLVLHRVAELLGLDEIFKGEGRYVLAFVYSHLLERPSIRKMEEWFQGTEIPEILGLSGISTGRLYKVLGWLNEIDFQEVEERLYQKFRRYERKKSSVIIDVTDTYFEGSRGDERPRRGKDGKCKKLLQIGLCVTEGNGFPILMKTYGGNISNFMIFRDLFVELVERGYRAVIMDRGMGSEENIKKALDVGMQIITGLKKTKGLKERYLHGIDREDIYRESCRVKLKNTSVYVKEHEYMEGSLIVVYNPHIEVIRREMLYERGCRGADSRYVGYSFIYHNTDLSVSEVVRKYYEKETIERAFKKLKGILSLRPIRVWRREQIEGHVRVCYLAYAILAMLEYYLKKKKVDLSAVELLEKLRRGYKVYLHDERKDFSWQTTVLLEKKLYKILDCLKCSV